MTTANRLASVQEYYFSIKLKEVNEMVSQGCDIINMGIGSPDLTPPPEAVAALNESMNDPNAHRYQAYRSLSELRVAMTEFYKLHFKVTLNPESEILPLMGSKEGIMHISMAFLNAGDHVLIPNPGYPTYESVTRLMEAKPVHYDLEEFSGWIPDLVKLSTLDLSKVKIMWINYPHMPSGTVVSSAKLFELVSFVKQHNILLINDNPYGLILNDDPMSLLSIQGAMSCCLELNSISKSFNMAGWRIGMVMGQQFFINDILKVKSNMDSGMFYGLQKGAIAALNSTDNWVCSLNNTYRERRKIMWQFADALGATYDKNSAGMFVWVKLSKGIDSVDFSNRILEDYHIFATPGDVFGSQGKGYLRLSLCLEGSRIEQAIQRLNNKKMN